MVDNQPVPKNPYWTGLLQVSRLKIKWINPALTDWEYIPASALFHDPDYLAEMQATDDNDGDGLTNDYENDNNLNPDDPDTDGDGLTDGEEVALGTNPLVADTDGDGIDDYTEVRIAFSDPLVADFDGTSSALGTTLGSSITGSSTGWMTNGDSIYSLARNGWLEYSVAIANAGTYCLEVTGEEYNSLAEGGTFVLDIYINGSYSGTQTLVAPANMTGKTLFFLPALNAGNHTVKLVWNNQESNTFLQINSLVLKSLGGPDADSNGLADWIDNRLENLGGIILPLQSNISPVCVEGDTAANIDQMEISGFYTEPGEDTIEPVIMNGINYTWYSNVSLDPAADTDLSFSFQDGATTVDRTVTWIETNVIQETSETTMIRLNDSLLLNAYPEGATTGTVSITVEGETLTPAIGNPIAYKFENTGDITVNATYTPDAGDPVTSSIAVKVVSAAFNTPIICMVNDPRTWNNPSLPDEAVYENDTNISFNVSDLPEGGKSFYMVALKDQESYIVARLGEDGPIIDSTLVETVIVTSNTDNTVTIIETFPDGSQMYEGYLVFNNIPAGLRIRIFLRTSGALFMNGTTELWLTAEDFDENGIYRYKMIIPENRLGAVCHGVEYYQGTELIGDN